MKLKTLLISTLLLITVSLSSAFAAQPHMEAALEHLRAARAELEKAQTDKAGHRQAAIQLLDKAIVETQRGVEAARPVAPARR